MDQPAQQMRAVLQLQTTQPQFGQLADQLGGKFFAVPVANRLAAHLALRHLADFTQPLPFGFLQLSGHIQEVHLGIPSKP